MIIPSEQFEEAYKKLPFTLREYLANDELSTITQEIGNRYGLHVDTIGALYRETTNMLLGFTNPSQFVNELRSVGVPQEHIGHIVQELNEKIFMPLRERMQKEGDADPYAESERLSKELSSDTVPPTQAASRIPAPQSYIPPTPPAAYTPPTPPPLVTTPASAPVAPSTPIYTPPTPQVSAPQPEHSYVRTMGEDIQQLQAHPMNQAPYQAPISQPRVSPPAPVTMPATAPVPPPQPQAWSAPAAPSTSETQAPASIPSLPGKTLINKIPPPAPKSDNHDELRKVMKEYGIDPYREPV
jgi:hypothetical protein